MSARKKRKVSTSSSFPELDYGHSSDLKMLLAHEIDLEISFRQRLAETIKSRIDWALILQESLANGRHKIGSGEAVNYREAALDAFSALEVPVQFLYSREPVYAPGLVPNSVTNQPPRLPVQPRSKSHRPTDGAVFRSMRGNLKLLFIRDNLVSPPVIYKMACPDCSRSDFTNLQGLFNHCRLLHKRDYGNHDECMQKCALVVPDDEKDWVVNNGTELGGVSLPGLRRLFQMAVGDGHGTALEAERQTRSDSPKELPSGNLLTRTLGHHKETPALAPFLGRVAQRRQIRVFDDTELVQIADDGQELDVSHTSTWRMSFAHRSLSKPSLDDAVYTSEAHVAEGRPVSAVLPPENTTSAGSRFHIVARVVISDYSHWLPPARRGPQNPDHTHRWMLSVDSTSYSLHITSFLHKLTLTCLTNPPPSTLLQPLTITTPPFAIMSTSDRPFLARIVLEWVGSTNPPVEVEHWVELDPMKGGSPILGEEQVLDVELDRKTELLPVRNDYCLPSWDGEYLIDNRSPAADASKESSYIPEHIRILRELLPQVPLTIKDAKAYIPGQLPYRMVPTPAQFRSLIPGRRKAIEWGRARALQALYSESMRSHSERLVHLTTGDIFRWMVDDGHFLRESTQKTNKHLLNTDKGNFAPSSQLRPGMFCSYCGLDFVLHPPSIQSKFNMEGNVFCELAHNSQVVRLPITDLGQVVPESRLPIIPPKESLHSTSQGQATNRACKLVPYSAKDFVSISDPRLALSILDVVSQLKLRCFEATHDSSPKLGLRLFPLGTLGETASSVEDRLAPYALLAILTKVFIRLLIRDGVSVANQDGANQSRSMNVRLLTPSHILRGIHGRALDQRSVISLLTFARVRLSNLDSPKYVGKIE